MPERPAGQSLLAFDFGEKRIGVACGQLISGTASPLAMVTNFNGRPDWSHIDQIIADWNPAALIVGLPEYHDQTQPIIEASRAFAKRLKNRYQISVHLHNESHTSNEATRVIAYNRRTQSRRKTRSGDLDKVAAALILESWMSESTGEN